MSAMSNLHAKVAEFETELRNVDHRLVGKFRDLVDHLLGQGATDAEQLATDAETAAKPVVAEAEHDAAALGETAVAEATQAAAADPNPQSASAAAPPIVGSKPASTSSASSPNSSSEA